MRIKFSYAYGKNGSQKIRAMKWFIDERILKHIVYVFEYDSTEIIERI